MNRIPQGQPNRAIKAERDRHIYEMRVAGMTERQIAADVQLAPSTVHEIIMGGIAERIGPVAQEYADAREAELVDLWSRAYVIAHDPERADDVRLRALDRCLRINESRRRLRGADAGESLSVSIERRSELEAEAVTAAVLAALDGLRLEGSRRTYAIELAQHALATIGEEHPIPPPPPPADMPPEPYVDPHRRFVIIDGVTFERPQHQQRRALPPGRGSVRLSERPGEAGGGPVPGSGPEDGAEAVARGLEALRRDLPELFEEDDDHGDSR